MIERLQLLGIVIIKLEKNFIDGFLNITKKSGEK